jgi:hypothetical protein
MSIVPVRRQALRLVEQLLREIAAPGTHVEAERRDPIKPARCPAYLVNYPEKPEAIQSVQLDGQQERVLTLLISTVVVAGQNAGDLLDDLAGQVEAALGTSSSDEAFPAMQQLLAFCSDIEQSNDISWFDSGDGQDVVAVCVQSWQFTYFTNPGRPEVPVR